MNPNIKMINTIGRNGTETIKAAAIIMNLREYGRSRLMRKGEIVHPRWWEIGKKRNMRRAFLRFISEAENINSDDEG